MSTGVDIRRVERTEVGAARALISSVVAETYDHLINLDAATITGEEELADCLVAVANGEIVGVGCRSRMSLTICGFQGRCEATASGPICFVRWSWRSPSMGMVAAGCESLPKMRRRVASTNGRAGARTGNTHTRSWVTR